MNYRETVDYILDIPLFAQKIGTENLASLLERLGNPQDKTRVIHVAGTNGKGSTAKALATLLMQTGFHVGLFTSPHLVSINERIKYDNSDISEEDFVWAFETVQKQFTVHPSFFEVMFAMAAVYFEKKKPDYVIYETGMGGRLDATNVVKPELCMITSVGLDHMEYLGDTIEKIAEEKAGIIKPSVPIVYFKRDAVSSGIIEAKAKISNSPVAAVEISQYIINEIDDKTIDFSLHNRYYNYDHLKIKRTSLYQVENACLAVTAFSILMKHRITARDFADSDKCEPDEVNDKRASNKVNDKCEPNEENGRCMPNEDSDKCESNSDRCMPSEVNDRCMQNIGDEQIRNRIIQRGLLNFSWEGRMEELAQGVYVDGAHNPEAIDSYCKTLQLLYNGKKKILIFAVVKDKDYDTMIKTLAEKLSFEKIIVAGVANKRKAPVSFIADRFETYTGRRVDACDSISEAMERAFEYRKQIPDSAIYCVGSLYLVGEVKKWMKEHA